MRALKALALKDLKVNSKLLFKTGWKKNTTVYNLTMLDATCLYADELN